MRKNQAHKCRQFGLFWERPLYQRRDDLMIDPIGDDRAAWLEAVHAKTAAAKLAETLDDLAGRLKALGMSVDDAPAAKIADLIPFALEACFQQIALTWRELGRDDNRFRADPTFYDAPALVCPRCSKSAWSVALSEDRGVTLLICESCGAQRSLGALEDTATVRRRSIAMLNGHVT